MSFYVGIQYERENYGKIRAGKKEINDFLIYVLQESLGAPNLTWSVGDLIILLNSFNNQMFQTLDIGYNRPHSHMVQVTKQMNIEGTFVHPCSNIKHDTPNYIKHYCETFSTYKTVDPEKIRDLMMKTSNRQHESFPGGGLGTIPLCFDGEDVARLRENLTLVNFPFPKNATNYGYKLCFNTKPTVTDIGICTTYNSANIFGSKDEKDKQNYPSEDSSETYEKHFCGTRDGHWDSQVERFLTCFL